MLNRWQHLASKFNAFALRERALLVGAFSAGVYLLFNLIFLMPLQKKIDVEKLLENTASQSLQAIDAELTVLEAASKKDPDADLRREREQLLSQQAELDKNLEAMAVGLIKAPDLPVMLQQLLQQTQSLTLKSLMTLPVVAVDLDIAKAGSAYESAVGNSVGNSIGNSIDSPVLGRAQLYKHGVEVQFEGSYSATFAFISALENSHWNFYWESLDYRVSTYPQALITLRLFTLASDKGVFDQGASAR
jgi:MSHA biogenesis protein MshJ